MKIQITAGELIDKGIWAEFCDLNGIDIWAVNEGLIESDETFIISEEQTKELGLDYIK